MPIRPLYLSSQELAEFNDFWSGLPQEDQAALEALIESGSDQLAAGRPQTRHQTLFTFVLYLLLDAHRDRRRLKAELDRLAEEAGA